MPSPSSARSLTSNLLLLFLSLICGTGVWLVVQLSERDEITLLLPVEVVNLDPTVKLTLGRNSVKVRFALPSTELNKMDPANFYVEIDYREIAADETITLEDKGFIALSRTMVRARNTNEIDMDLLNINVTEVLVTQVAYEASRRTIPAIIEPQISGRPASGYVVRENGVDVEEGKEITAVLEAWKQEELRNGGVETLKITTEPVNIQGANNTIREPVELVLPEGVRLSQDSASWRTVIVDIEEQIITRTLEDIDLVYRFISRNENLEATFNPSVVDIEIRGTQSAVSSITGDMIVFGYEGVVERSGETREVPVEARLRNIDDDIRREIQTLDVNPPVVEITIKRAEGEDDVENQTDPSESAETE